MTDSGSKMTKEDATHSRPTTAPTIVKDPLLFKTSHPATKDGNVNFSSTAATITDPNASNEELQEKYRSFRDKLMNFALGEAAFDYAERLYSENSRDPNILALLGETCWSYNQTKNKAQRDHWVDRLDLFQRGVDISRKCMKEHPDFGPCHRSFILNAVGAAEIYYYVRPLQGLGMIEHYKVLTERGKRAMALNPGVADIPDTLAFLTTRCTMAWYNPYRFYGLLYGVPSQSVMVQETLKYAKQAVESEPDSVKFSYHLGQAYFNAGDVPNARKELIRCRDDILPKEAKDAHWQSAAHTFLTARLTKAASNVPLN